MIWIFFFLAAYWLHEFCCVDLSIIQSFIVAPHLVNAITWLYMLMI